MFDKEHTVSGIQPYLDAIRDAILAGFKIRPEKYGDVAAIHRPSTRAGIVNDHIVDEARRRLKGLGITVVTVRNRILFDLKGKALVHFKRLDRRKIGRNYPTLFAKQFSSQMELPGLPKIPRLVAGFIPDDSWTDCKGIYVTLPSNISELGWSHTLFETGHQTPELPLFPESNESVPQRKRVRVPRPTNDQKRAVGE